MRLHTHLWHVSVEISISCSTDSLVWLQLKTVQKTILPHPMAPKGKTASLHSIFSALIHFPLSPRLHLEFIFSACTYIRYSNISNFSNRGCLDLSAVSMHSKHMLPLKRSVTLYSNAHRAKSEESKIIWGDSKTFSLFDCSTQTESGK